MSKIEASYSKTAGPDDVCANGVMTDIGRALNSDITEHLAR